MKHFVAFSLLTCWAHATCLAQTSSPHSPKAAQYLLTAEETSAETEESRFPQLHAVRRVGARHAHDGQAAVQLVAHGQPATLASTLLPVQPGKLTLTVYAQAASPAATRSWPGYVGRARNG